MVTQQTKAYTVDEFISDLQTIVHEETEPAQIIARAEPRLRELLKNPNFLTEEQKQVAADGKSTGTYLHQAPNLSVRAVVFPEGKPTPVHDHLTWGMVGVYEGAEREEKFDRRDDGSRPGYADLQKVSETVYQPGEVTTFYPPNDIHTVMAVSSTKSVSVHVYGEDMEALDRHQFDLATGEVKPFKTRTSK